MIDVITVTPDDIGKTFVRRGPWGQQSHTVSRFVPETSLHGGEVWEDERGIRFSRRLHADSWSRA